MLSNRRPVDDDMDESASNVDSQFVEEEEVSKEQLQMIKARTMFQMVEELEGGTTDGSRKMLFLTNAQADFLCSSPDSLQKMLDALETPKPKLVINLLTSHGFDGYCKIKQMSAKDLLGEDAGIVYGRAAFTSAAEERRAEERLDRFMAEVLIPLAAQTNAIVFCNASPSVCILSAALTRMYAVQRSKWGSKAPFTIISATAAIALFYCNPDSGANWRGVRKQSRAWRARDKKLLELVHRQRADADGKLPVRYNDLDANASCYLIVDGIDERKDKCNVKASFTKLINELLRYLASTLPALALKTANANKVDLSHSTGVLSGMGIAMEAAMSGTPLLFLDVRERPKLDTTANERGAIIKKAQEQFSASCDELLAAGVAETFDCCSIAHFHTVCVGDVSGTDETRVSKGAASAVPLHLALRRAAEGNADTSSADESDFVRPATTEMMSEVASWIADRVFSDAWQLVPKKEREELEKKGVTYETHYRDLVYAHSVCARSILTSPNFHALNLSDMEQAQRLVSHLVRLDRLPKGDTLEGLHLLREAWCEYDVAMHLADRYKFISKLVFIVQLILVWSIVVCTYLSIYDGSSALGDADMCAQLEVKGWLARPAPQSAAALFPECQEHVPFEARVALPAFLPGIGNLTLFDWAADISDYANLAFLLAVGASVLISIESILNAKQRWRQLRSGAGSLESIIWCFRTRVGIFELRPSDPDAKRPETNLVEAIVSWRQELVSGGDLQVSALGKKYAPGIYKHYQDGVGGAEPLGADDYHSPVHPQLYIEVS